MVLIRGTSEDDTLVGSEFQDTLDGDDGDDLLQGLGGNDTLLGEDDDDTLEGGSSNDKLFGGEDDDFLDGGEGADSLDGSTGSDTANYENSEDGVAIALSTGEVSGGEAQGDTLTGIENLIGSLEGENTLSGNNDDNFIVGGEDEDELSGEDGNDTIEGGLEEDTIAGGSGDDSLIGGQDFDSLIGDAGNDSPIGGSRGDTLQGDSGADLIDGGADKDAASYADSSEAVSINLATLTLSGGDAEGDTLSSIENLIGSDNNDILIGDSNNNVLEGGGGADTLDGGVGEDKASYVDSEAGVNVNLATQTFSGGDAEGDTISNIKNLIGSDEDDTLIGDDRDNILEGIEGDDLVQGNDGNDRLYGGEDDDTIEGGSGADLLQGNEDDDYLSGGANNDTIFGGEDDDTIEGGGDLNFLSGDAGDDSLIGGTVNDTLLGGFDNDTLFGDAGIDTLDGGSENDFLDGGEDNDLLTGATGDDTLIGGEGDDIVNGGFGIDSLAGGSGADIFEYNELQDSTLDRGIDRIEDLEIGSDVVAVPEVIAGTEVPPLGAVDNLDEASIASVLTDDTFAANTAVTFTEGERAFLAINDGNAGFSASNDGLIEITGFSGDLADFSLGNSNQITDVPTQSASLPDSSLPQTEVPWQNEELDPQQIFIEDASQIQDAIANANPGDTLIGLSAIQLWSRDFGHQNKYERNYQKLPIEAKESYKWLASVERSQRCLTAGGAKMVTNLGDGESDLYEEWTTVPDGYNHLLVRVRPRASIIRPRRIAVWLFAINTL